MDELQPPTTAESLKRLARIGAGFVCVLLASLACYVGATSWPRLEPLFFSLMLGVWGLAVALLVRGKIRHARSHQADVPTQPSAYQLRVERRARLLGIWTLCAWVIFTVAATIDPSLRWPGLWVGGVLLVGVLIVFAVDEWRQTRRAER